MLFRYVTLQKYKFNGKQHIINWKFIIRSSMQCLSSSYIFILLTTHKIFFFHRIIPYCSYVVRYNSVKEKEVLSSVIRVAYQEYRCYGSHRSLYRMTDITSEQMRFRAVQLKGYGNDDWKRIERCITFELFVCINIFLTCTSFIGIQDGKSHQRLQYMVKFTPCYTEEPHKFALRHGNGFRYPCE